MTTVALDELLEYADASDDPGARAGIPRLAYMVGVDELDDHLYDAAAYHLEIGLRYAPENLSLLSHLALARWGRRKYDDALVAFERAIALCRRAGKVAPMLWLLAARALDERDRPRDALPLLEDLAALLPPDDGFWELLAAVRERAR